MQQPNVKGMEGWVEFLTNADIPVLKQTERDLAVLHLDQNKLSARGVAQAISIDPMMTVKLLRYLQLHKHSSQTSEVALVEQALIMLGVEAFFTKIPAHPTVQDLLSGHMDALVRLLHRVHRAHRASEYAYDWAVRLSDLHYEEVRIAALLHDVAETLLWCFAPQDMMKIREIQYRDKTIRTRAAQEQVLGFAVADLQKSLVQKWNLPELLLMLMDDQNATQPRVRNVELAVNLARHSSNGWDDAALPDDYKDIGELLRMPADQVMVMVGADAGIICDLNKPH